MPDYQHSEILFCMDRFICLCHTFGGPGNYIDYYTWEGTFWGMYRGYVYVKDVKIDTVQNYSESFKPVDGYEDGYYYVLI